MNQPFQVLTVTQVTTYLRSVIDADPNLSCVFLTGEISNFTNHLRSGHFYFSLKDENSLIRCVMFRSSNQRLRFEPKNGMKVLVRGRISVYAKDGSYQLYAEDMQPDGAGALALAFEQLKQKLLIEGLFASEKKRPLPAVPRRVGVITSQTGAAVRDILNILARRFPLAQVVFCPVLVQGSEAPAQLVRAIELFNSRKAADVLIIGRGGGSAEELWAFNDEGLVRAVAQSQIPIISAVGHETDYTLCDFAADLRAPTPSAAAELAVPDQYELADKLRALRLRLNRLAENNLLARFQALHRLTSRRCLASPGYTLESRRVQLDHLALRLNAAQKTLTARQKEYFSALCGKLNALSPLAVLARGYGAVFLKNAPVESIAQVNTGDALQVRLKDGTISCRVTGIKGEN